MGSDNIGGDNGTTLRIHCTVKDFGVIRLVVAAQEFREGMPIATDIKREQEEDVKTNGIKAETG